MDDTNALKSITTPISGPPPSVDYEHTNGKETPTIRRSSRLSKRKTSNDETDPPYTPTITLSDSSDDIGFECIRRKKGHYSKKAPKRSSKVGFQGHAKNHHIKVYISCKQVLNKDVIVFILYISYTTSL